MLLFCFMFTYTFACSTGDEMDKEQRELWKCCGMWWVRLHQFLSLTTPYVFALVIYPIAHVKLSHYWSFVFCSCCPTFLTHAALTAYFSTSHRSRIALVLSTSHSTENFLPKGSCLPLRNVQYSLFTPLLHKSSLRSPHKGWPRTAEEKKQSIIRASHNKMDWKEQNLK